MTMYITGICRSGNSVAELQGFTSQVLLDTDKNGLDGPAAALSVCSVICYAWGGGDPSEWWCLFAMLHDAVSYKQQSLRFNEFFGKTVG